MERLRDILGHPYELIVHGERRRALHHKVANGLCGVAETERSDVGALQMGYSRESGSPPASCAMTLANEKVRWRMSFQDGWGPRKVPSWCSNLP